MSSCTYEIFFDNMLIRFRKLEANTQIKFSLYFFLQFIQYFLDGSYASVNSKICLTKQSLSTEITETMTQELYPKLDSIFNTLLCIHNDCKSQKYSNMKHTCKLNHIGISNIFHHHISLNPNIDQLFNNKNKSIMVGDWIIYEKIDNSIKIIMLYEHYNHPVKKYFLHTNPKLLQKYQIKKAADLTKFIQQERQKYPEDYTSLDSYSEEDERLMSDTINYIITDWVPLIT